MPVVISGYGFADRIVKQFFKVIESPCICVTRAPICNGKRRLQFQSIINKSIVADEKKYLPTYGVEVLN
jgi:16S rRNA C1402 N4-methylase RsmH